MTSEFLHGFRLGPWMVEPLRGAVTGPEGVERHLEPKVMNVFVCLARHANEVMTRDELHEAVWGGRAVTDESLTRAIRELRRALDDGNPDSHYIETVPKRGYRLIGDISMVDVAEVESDQSGLQTRRHSLAYVVVSAGVLALIFAAYHNLVIDPTPVRSPDSGLSIAVLPFDNMSDDPGNEYFADGLSEEILNLLAKIPDLKVIARTSSFAFKGTNEDLRIIGERLGVNTVLEGSVRKSGDRVRISAQLNNVNDGTLIWSETYERELSEIFSVQDDVAAAIIGALQVHVGANPARRRPTENMEAYALFLKARIALDKDSSDVAGKFLLNAIELDPEFAEAYELLSFCLYYHCGEPLGTIERRERIYEFATRALAINPDLVFAKAMYLNHGSHNHSFLGRLKTFEWAVLKEPSNTKILEALAWDLVIAGYAQEALAVAERYLELDPLSLPANNSYWRSLYAVGRTDEAFAALDIFEQLGGDNAPWVRGRLNLNAGRDDIAIANFEAYLEQQRFTDTSWVREVVAGARDSANGQAYLDRRIPEIVASMPQEHAFSWQETLSRWYLHFGFLDRYFDSIPDPATDAGDSVWSDIETPVFEGTIIRRSGFTAHPRYLELAKTFGFVEAWEERGPPDFCQKLEGNWACE